MFFSLKNTCSSFLWLFFDETLHSQWFLLPSTFRPPKLLTVWLHLKMISCNQQQKAAWSFGLQSFIPCHQGNVGRTFARLRVGIFWWEKLKPQSSKISPNLTKIHVTCSTPTVSPTFLLPLLNSLVVSWIFSFSGFWPGTVKLSAHDTRCSTLQGGESTFRGFVGVGEPHPRGSNRREWTFADARRGSLGCCARDFHGLDWCQTNSRHSCPKLMVHYVRHYVFQVFFFCFFFERVISFRNSSKERLGWRRRKDDS